MEFNLNNKVRPHLAGVKSYQTLRDSYINKQAVYLDANENPFGEFNRYPDGDPIQLKKKLAEINQAKTENLFLGNGSDELIDLTMRIFCEPTKDSILIMNPSFVMYEIYARMNNVQVEKLELNSGFQLEKDLFLDTVSKSQAKVLFLCSPNNPTGNSIDDLEFYIQNFNGIVVVDEAYIEFSPEDSAVKLLNKYPNLIVLKTLSKAFGMAGLRIGVGFSSIEIASLFIQLKPPYNISSESQKLALLQLNNLEVLKNNISIILKEKEKLKLGLEGINSVVKIFPSDANFFLIEFKDAQLIYQKLLDKNILTSLRHPSLNNCLRISVGNADENSELLKVLSEIKES
ncbi:histidinol-phosphate transaminase [Kaistella palustris]|uniref:histidinol-phosphate transaminase n=1 Tax=Kaistella palustris TaxID=493376 RepID=UPI0004168C1F|nr:histidinol-phosphate transaminase [Kaistella palustris]